MLAVMRVSCSRLARFGALARPPNVVHSMLRDAAVPGVPLDVGSGLLRGDPALRGAHPRRVPQRIVPRAASHLGFDRLQSEAPRGHQAMVAVGEQQPFRGVENDRRQQGVAFNPCGVQVRFGVDRRVREEFGYAQSRHGAKDRFPL